MLVWPSMTRLVEGFRCAGYRTLNQAEPFWSMDNAGAGLCSSSSHSDRKPCDWSHHSVQPPQRCEGLQQQGNGRKWNALGPVAHCHIHVHIRGELDRPRRQVSDNLHVHIEAKSSQTKHQPIYRQSNAPWHLASRGSSLPLRSATELHPQDWA